MEIVTCKHCGKEEYSLAMHWLNSKTMCRACIYKTWQLNGHWEPGEHDHTFPLYDDGKDHRLKTYYVSLVRGLCGYYVKFNALNEETVRNHVAKYFGQMWCSVYDEGDLIKVKERHPDKTWVINEDRPIELLSYEWE